MLLGDAAHTAHFSIGSGTKLAMEDALALAACLHEEPTLAAALATYDTERRAVVLSTQRAAQASLEWFENLGQYLHQEPLQFAFNIMTRSRRVTYDNLRLRDPEFVARCDEWYAASVGSAESPPADVPAGPDRLPRPGQPGGRLADGHVRRRRRPDLGLPPGAPRRQGARRGGAGDDRDGVRVAGGPDHAGLRRALGRRAAGVVPTGHRLRAHQHPGEDRAPARPLRRQGLDQADVGGHRRAARRGQLGGRRPLAGALPRGCQPGAARAHQVRDGHHPRPVRRVRASRRRGGLRPAGAALRPRLPALGVPLARHQPAHRRLRRRRRRPAALPARGVRRPA